MNRRIRELRKALGLNQTEFASKIGLGQGAVSHMEQDGAKITDKNIINICATFHVSNQWLRTGEGEMFSAGNRRQMALMAYFEDLTSVFQDQLIKTAIDLLDLQTKLALQEPEESAPDGDAL